MYHKPVQTLHLVTSLSCAPNTVPRRQGLDMRICGDTALSDSTIAGLTRTDGRARGSRAEGMAVCPLPAPCPQAIGASGFWGNNQPLAGQDTRFQWMARPAEAETAPAPPPPEPRVQGQRQPPVTGVFFGKKHGQRTGQASAKGVMLPPLGSQAGGQNSRFHLPSLKQEPFPDVITKLF